MTIVDHVSFKMEQSRYLEEALEEEVLEEVDPMSQLSQNPMELDQTTMTTIQNPQIQNLKEKLYLHLSENQTLRLALLLSLLRVHSDWDKKPIEQPKILWDQPDGFAQDKDLGIK